MIKLLQEIKDDLDFIQSHTLQPKWYKVLKVFILAGVLVGYYFFFGWIKTVAFFGTFLSLSLLIHMLYRIRTNKWTRSWLDFVVVRENNEIKPKRIGVYYYLAILFNTIISIVISQVFA